jgi:mono/diheme cytochrome c family protein
VAALAVTLAVAVTGYAEVAAPAADAGDPVVFDRDIKPIFEASCYLCHGPEKQKAELRLDSHEAILAGSEYGPAIVAGKPEESTLYSLVTLPPDDPDVMPAKGDPLTPEQADLVRRWILQGAVIVAADGAPAPAPAPTDAPAPAPADAPAPTPAPAPADAPAAEAAKEAAPSIGHEGPSLLDKLAEGVPAPPEDALNALRDLGVVAMPLDMTTPLVSVNLQYLGDTATDETLAQLQPLAQQITWLNLAGTAVTDAGLAQVAQLPNLTRLHLEKTAVGDAGLAQLKPLTNLEYLNLYGTQVSDAGLANLEAMQNLRKLYLWESQATADGANKLNASLPGVIVNLGVQLAVAVEEQAAPEPAPESTPKDLAFLFDAESCCAKGKAEGKACDHPCCVEAAAKGEVCLKCNAGAEAKLALAKQFVADSCCAKAFAEGKACDHPCCVEATTAGKVCEKCNPGTAVPKDVAFLFDAESCCAKAKAEGKVCDHPCCVEAAAKGEVCIKCNAGAEAKLALAKQFGADSCCAKAFAEGKACDHPCCVEAAAAGKICEKCNPSAGKADLSALFDEGSCCAKACAEGKACEHPCCVEAAGKGEVCLKCNPGAKDKLEKDAAPAEESPPAEEAPAPEEPPKPAEPKVASDDAKVAAAPASTLEFNRHIRPILSNNCFECHGFDKNARKADLRLDVRESAIGARGDHVAIVPGDSAASELVRRITTDDPDDAMPPADSEHELTPEEVQALITWIDEGAEYEPHWSYIAVNCPEPPAVGDDWASNPIDRFILAKLQANDLQPSSEADRATLIRRVSFDLTGLPPAPHEVDAFVNDSDPNAYENLVDRLLASPHFGERMAMRWLDLVRYADTNGYHGDEHRNVWPYRDYVIQSFNENKPFDQFTIEQLAGDLLPEPTRDQFIASGYNRMNQLTAEGGAQEKEYLAKYAADRIRTTTSVWLGTTMGCAECHDHKFDPITTREFYQFSAFFADIEEKGVYGAGDKWAPFMPLPSDQQAVEKTDLESAIASLEQTLNTTTDELAAAQREWEANTRVAIADSYNDWTTLMPAKSESSGGATLQVGSDLLITATGTDSATDVYTLSFRTSQQNITGIRLDALPDPENGNLSRGNGNFVLTGFEVQVECGDTCTPAPISNVVADFEQLDYPIIAAIDDDPYSGWAVLGHEKKGESRQAVFTFAEPVPGGPGTTLTVRMKHESPHTNHNIARFRLALTTAPEPALTTSSALGSDVFASLMADEVARTDEQKQLLAKHYRGVAPALESVRVELKAKQERLAKLTEEIPTTLISHAVEPRTIRILPRGNFLDESGEIVEPGTPASLPPLGVEGRRATRLDLARWLVSPENPLTARVTVNRLWEQFFGMGISKVLDDVGSRGEWPTHPDLLDWMASEFVNSGWDMKHVVRLMVTSSAYRQSSAGSPELRAQDPSNRLLARQSQVRLKAELVRDNALAISGLLSPMVGGRSVYPYQPDGYWDNCNTFRGPLIYSADEGENQYRRGLYTYWKRSFLHPSILAFDAPTREECTAERTVSNTPMQALVLLNDPTFVEAARVFAERILNEGGDTPEAKMDYAFERALCRKPTDAERALLLELCSKHMDDFASDAESATRLVTTGFAPQPESIDKAELAAWTSVARAILNLHETITRS